MNGESRAVQINQQLPTIHDRIERRLLIIFIVMLMGRAFSAAAQPENRYIEKPVPLREALRPEPGYRDEASQAAFLLVLANLLRTEGEHVEPEAMAPPIDLEELGAPTQVLAAKLSGGERWSLSELTTEVTARAGALSEEDQSVEKINAVLAVERRLLTALGEHPDRKTAALYAASAFLAGRDEGLVRVGSAAALAEVVPQSDRQRELVPLLADETASRDLKAMVAATTLARLQPDHPALRDLTGGKEGKGREPIHTSLIVHGTWAANGLWWRNQGDFHGYLRQTIAPDLYSGADAFNWSGSWSDTARADGAARLRKWAASHHTDCLNLFAHSHGSNVAFLANLDGLKFGRMVLLSTPVWWNKYHPRERDYTSTISIRTKLDLVILADGGGQRFPPNTIPDYVLNIWFDHSATHDPAVWRQHPPRLPDQRCPEAEGRGE